MNALILEIVGLFFVIIVGTLLHFAYQYSGKKPIVGVFSPVNESTWEHLKLLFFPMLFYTLLEYFTFGKLIPNFLSAKSAGMILGMIAIVVIFYTYTGILGKNYLWADILTFILGVMTAFGSSVQLIKNGTKLSNGFVAVVIFLALCFIIFTFKPPRIGLFLDPVSKGYGILNKKPNIIR